MKRALRGKLATRRSTKPKPGPRTGPQITGRVQQNSYTATAAKNKFGLLLDKVDHGQPIVITRHGAERAVLVSAKEFYALRSQPEQKLATLRGEFDRLFARMQTTRFHSGMSAAFHASPEKLGKAAVAAARKRG